MTEVLLDRGPGGVGLVESVLTVLPGLALGILPLVGLTTRAADSMEWVVAGIFAVASLLALTLAALHLFGHERILLENGRLRAIRDLGPFRREWSVLVTDITAVEVPALELEYRLGSWGVGHPSLLVRTSSGSRGCCVALSPLEAERIAERVRQALAD